jgi:GTP:adenosylcobinamide-phosphate guanylyltransferase
VSTTVPTAPDPTVTRASVTALVLAGSRHGGDPLAAHAGVSHKCLLPVAGVPMLTRVVAALGASPSIGSIVISIEDPEAIRALPVIEAAIDQGRVRILASDRTPARSVLAALDSGLAGPPTLITTADHALLSTEIVEHFLAAARASGADLAAGLVAAPVILAADPEAERTFLRFRDGRFSGANLFARLGEDGRNAVAFWRRVEQVRKRPWRMVRAFGLGALIRYALGLSTLEATMARASAIIGARAVAIPLPFAEAAIDVDKPADLALVEAILAR